MRSSKKCHFSDALTALFPEAQIRQNSCKEWHSATFSGQRILLLLSVSGAHEIAHSKGVIATIADHEFDLSRRIVADVMVSNVIENEENMTFEIEALVLDA